MALFVSTDLRFLCKVAFRNYFFLQLKIVNKTNIQWESRELRLRNPEYKSKPDLLHLSLVYRAGYE